jgi:hypothetical protein
MDHVEVCLDSQAVERTKNDRMQSSKYDKKSFLS